MKKQPVGPFIWMTVGFVAIVWVRLITMPVNQSLGIAVPLTLALAVILGLHATLLGVVKSGRTVPYFVAQLTLGGVVMLLTKGESTALILFMPLIGEVFGVFTSLRLRVLAFAGIAAVWLAVLWATGQTGLLRVALPAIIGSFAFVGVFTTLFVRQLNERERAEGLLAELEEAHGRLRAYADRVEELTITAERQRMARELHDTLAQGLAGLIMQLEAIDDLLERGDGTRARDVTGRALTRARTTLREARVAIQALRSAAEPRDLLSGVTELINEFRADHDITCGLDAEPAASQVEGPASGQLLRVLREGLANVARHAEARSVMVRVGVGEGIARLEIVDDGRGFDPSTVPVGHYGLLGLTERLRLAGGALTIDSRPGAGTRLVASLPLTSHAAGGDADE